MVMLLRDPRGLRTSYRPGLGQPLGVGIPRRSPDTKPTQKRTRPVHTRAMNDSFDLSLYHEASISEYVSLIGFLRVKNEKLGCLVPLILVHTHDYFALLDFLVAYH